MKSVILGATFGRAAPRNDGEKWCSRQGTCVYSRVVVEAPPPLLAMPSPARGPSLRLLLLPLLLLLLPNGAWSQLWKGAEVWVTLIEKQLAAVYHALVATEPITRTAPTKVITTYPIAEWVRDCTQSPWSGVAQTSTVYHVTGHLHLASPGNDEADALAQVRWLEGKPASDVAQRLHQCLLHMGQKTNWALACRWGLQLTFEEVSQAWKECPAHCADQQTTKRGLECLFAAYAGHRLLRAIRAPTLVDMHCKDGCST
ncbi:uncharacterized protein LOC130682963 [Manis pentadactyla]|uniref:uncharacterized protein LOC130682963 n=1 Tax=Manis pentadactyla TaxID=143292 RepID=UPI00255C691F|nr:uncharacterized protein LOC130682963 [Manis pentadactyla]